MLVWHGTCYGMGSDVAPDGTASLIHGLEAPIRVPDVSKPIALTLPGTPEAEAFRIAILSARNAWVPGKARTQPFIAASAAK